MFSITRGMEDLPVALIGGGPIGLAAAAHPLDRGTAVKVYEAGAQVAANVRDWGHVSVLPPWRYCVDKIATKMLEREGWLMPPDAALPTGDEIVRGYLEPLASLPSLAAAIETGARISAISRMGVDKVVSRDRESRPFTLTVETAQGVRRELARAVIDASGTLAHTEPFRRGRARGRLRSGIRHSY